MCELNRIDSMYESELDNVCTKCLRKHEPRGDTDITRPQAAGEKRARSRAKSERRKAYRSKPEVKAMESEYNKRWHANNHDKRAELRRKWRAENPDKVRAQQERFRARSVEKRKAYNAEYYKKNLEKVRKNHAEYRQNNGDKVKQSRRNYRLKVKARKAANAKLVSRSKVKADREELGQHAEASDRSPVG